jgi:glycogen operon protein
MEAIPSEGKAFPLGATTFPGGVNFCVFSKNAAAVELVFFDSPDDAAPKRVIQLDPKKNKTFYYWHAFVPGIGHGQLYGYRVYGKYKPERGHWFDGTKLLLDPYAKGVAVGQYYQREAAKVYGRDNCREAMKSVVIDTQRYDWGDDQPLRRPFSKSIIYELHVGGFTKSPTSGVSPDKRGTYTGLIEKIPYLKSLGVTAVELLPVQQYDPHDSPGGINYWGYSPIGFFAPHHAYGTSADSVSTINEFRDMVRALHKAGIEVILDVVFNHTSEAGFNGATQCFRGFENVAYYTFDKGGYQFSNYSGCGNTFNANHSIVRRLIMDALRYWVSEMHVDGFRFDLASVMSRDENGIPLENPPILWEIESEPVLAGSKIIAEAWDAAGLYQVGKFIGDRWSEWNGVYRDDVRRFMKGDERMVINMARRITGSPDLFANLNRDPNRSVNFISCHDGFTLNDLVSYNYKHNEMNGENNRDGSNDNYSWNCGVEGETHVLAIERIRLRQIKNFLAMLMVSQGTPMLLMGDEVRRTQKGNNNAYCQDNELSWFNWEDVEKHKGVLEFLKGLINLRKSFPLLHEERFWIDQQKHKIPHISWHGVKIGQPDWGDNSHSLSFTLGSPKTDQYLHVMINAFWEPLRFELPSFSRSSFGLWKRMVDTSLPGPYDFVDASKAHALFESHYTLTSRSVVILLYQEK